MKTHNIWRIFTNLLLMCGTIIVLSACGTEETPRPVGIGRDVNDLKRSPCACFEIKQYYEGWFNLQQSEARPSSRKAIG